MTILPLIRQLSIAVATFSGALSVGASLGYSSVLLYQLGKKDSEFPIDLDTSSWIGSLHGFASISGAMAPLIMQWKGRKLTFIVACLILITGWMLVHTANSITMILLSEAILGFSSCVVMIVSYDILTEMITPAYRNNAGQTYCIFNSLGVAVSGAMTRFLHWRVISIILCLPAVTALVISCTWLESPLWLAYKNDLDRCKTNFLKLRGAEEHSLKELQEVISVHKERMIKNKGITKDSVAKRLWRQVSSMDFIRPVLHILLLLFHLYGSGAIVIMIYSIQLVLKATQNESAAFIGGIIMNFTFVVSAIFSNLLVKFLNNKIVLMIGTCCGAITCLLGASMTTYLQSIEYLPKDSLLTIYFLLGYTISTGSGQVPIERTIATEIIPVKHRGLGGGVYVISGSAMNAFFLKVSPYLFAYLGLWGTFLVFAFNCAVCGLLIWKYVPETKGRTLQEIEHFYSHGTFEVRLMPKEEMEEICNQLN